MTNTLFTALLLLVACTTYSMEEGIKSAIPSVVLKLKSTEGTEHPISKEVLELSDMLKATQLHNLKEKKDGIIEIDYDTETTQAIVDLLESMKDKDTSAFSNTLEQFIPDKTEEKNEQLQNCKKLFDFLQINKKGYQEIAFHLEQALKQSAVKADIHHLYFLEQLLPDNYVKNEYQQKLLLLNDFVNTLANCTLKTVKNSISLEESSSATALTFKDNLLISNSADETIKIWDLDLKTLSNSTQPIATLSGHNSYIDNLAIKDNLLISGSRDKTIKIWDVDLKTLSNNTQPIATLSGHAESIHNLAIKDNLLISSSYDKTIKIWDLDLKTLSNSTQPIATLSGHAESIRNLAIKDNLLISGSYDKTIKIWDLDLKTLSNSTQPIATLSGHTDWICNLIIKDNLLISGSCDNTIKIWDLDFNKLTNSTQPIAILSGHTESILSLVVKDNLLISGSYDKTIKIWDLDLKTLSNSTQPVATLSGHANWVASLIIKDNLLISGSYDKTIKIWDLDLKTLSNSTQPIATLSNYPNGIGIASLIVKDNLLISGSYDKTIKIWDLSCFSKTKQYFTQNLTFLEILTLQIINNAFISHTTVPLTKMQRTIIDQLMIKLEKEVGVTAAKEIKDCISKLLSTP